jgi:type II secretion system protein I
MYNMVMFTKESKGFTVVELLVAIAIFGIVIPSLTAAVTSLTVLNNRARDLTLVNIIASNKAEQLRSSGFNSLNAGTYTFTAELPNEISNPKTATYTVDTATPGQAQITINITFKDYNRTITKTYRTVVSELGVGQ